MKTSYSYTRCLPLQDRALSEHSGKRERKKYHHPLLRELLFHWERHCPTLGTFQPDGRDNHSTQLFKSLSLMKESHSPDGRTPCLKAGAGSHFSRWHRYVSPDSVELPSLIGDTWLLISAKSITDGDEIVPVTGGTSSGGRGSLCSG